MKDMHLRRRLAPRWLMATASLLALWSPAAFADLVVPAGANFTLGGYIDMGCTDVVADGTLDLAGGTLSNVRNVLIGAGGQVNLGNGTISLAGNWTNGGGTLGLPGTVAIVDDVACATSSVISGNTTFGTLSITSSSGKLVQFAVGSTQTVQQSLVLTGTGTPLRIESTTPATPSADLHLAAGATQSVSNVAVQGMSASGQMVAPGQTNQAPPGAAVSNWFAAPVPPTPANIAPVPTNSPITLLGMALAVAALAARQRFGRKNKPSGRSPQ